MELLPAIDLREGRVVRLRQGDDRRRTTYELDPITTLLAYADAGVQRVHVIDLDGALGETRQRELISSMAAMPGAPRIQLGGGLRDAEAIEWALDIGCDRVVITSLLVRDFDLCERLTLQYPRRIVPALDIDGGKLMLAGWTESAPRPLDEICRALAPLPLPAILVTDIERDGMLEGPNFDLACRLARDCKAPALLSGGVRSLTDLAAATKRPEISGAIVGRALYDGALDLGQAIRVCAGKPPQDFGTSPIDPTPEPLGEDSA